MQKVTIRKATAADARALCILGNEFLKHLENTSPLLALESLRVDARSIASWRSGIVKPPKNFFTFVAEVNGVVVGYMELMIKDNVPTKFFKVKKFGWMEAMVVAKEYRSKGIGSKMYDYGLRFFRARKIKYVRGSVFLKNTTALSFWKNRGFVEESVEMYKRL
ncbi:MAG: GNAT family N-acetyltransferase [Candidatus Woesearchaeota archaeon]